MSNLYHLVEVSNTHIEIIMISIKNKTSQYSRHLGSILQQVYELIIEIITENAFIIMIQPVRRFVHVTTIQLSCHVRA